MQGLRSLTLSVLPCRERRKLVKPKTARSRRSLFVEVSQRRGGANEPSSSLFLPLPPPPSSPVVPFLSFAFPCHSSFFSYQRSRLRFHLSFSSFSLERRSRLSRPTLQIIRSPFFFSHSVLLFLSASHSLLLLAVSFSSCSYDSFYEVASSAYNYCRYVLLASLFVSFLSYTLLYFIRSERILNLVSISFYHKRKCF